MSILFHIYLSVGKKKFILLVLLMCTTFLNARAQSININDSASIFTNSLSPEETVLHLNWATLYYSKFPNNRINFGITGNEYSYVLLKIIAPVFNDNQRLFIDNTSLDTVDIYRVYPDNKIQLLYQGGNLMEYKNEIYNWHTIPIEATTFPSYYLIALKARQKNINVRYEILDKNNLQLKYQAYDRVVYFYIGVATIILIVIIVAYFHSKKAEFAAYAGYILCFAGWVLAHYGRLFPLLYPQFPIINEVIKPVSSLSACFFLIIVLYLVFKQSLHPHCLMRGIIKQVLYGLVLFIGLMFLFFVPNLPSLLRYCLLIIWHIGLLISIILVVYIPVILFNSGITAKIFSAAMLAVALMALTQVVATVGLVNSFFINEHGLTIGSLLEISIMAFGLFFSLLVQMKEREKQILSLEQEQTETLKRLVTVQDNERKRIAADLHDNIGPLLAALKINFGRIVHTKNSIQLNGVVVKTEGIIDDSIAEIRNVAHNLMPKGLSSNGLISTLKEYLNSIEELYNKKVDFKHQVLSIFSTEIQTNLYRIICELVLNAARHSKANLISVEIKANHYSIFLNIEDNGQGFQQTGGDKKKSLGLQSAESRVSYLKGNFILQSEKDKGTKIYIEIPLQFDESHINSF